MTERGLSSIKPTPPTALNDKEREAVRTEDDRTADRIGITTKRLLRFWSYVQVKSGCWTWNGPMVNQPPNDYGCFGRGAKMVRAHRLMWEIVRGEIPEGKQVLHNCDNPRCVNPKHLFLGTNLDNIHDRMSKGRPSGKTGEGMGIAKLMNVEASAIRTLHRWGARRKDLQFIFMVSEPTIRRLVHGETYPDARGF